MIPFAKDSVKCIYEKESGITKEEIQWTDKIIGQHYKQNRIMDIMNFAKISFCHLLTLIERDDGNKKNKTLEKEAGLPCF